MNAVAVGLMLLASLSTAAAQLCFKGGLGGARPWVGVVAGVGCYAISLGLMVAAYRLDDLTRLTPLLSLAVVWTALLAGRVLDERMDARRWLGVLLIVLGSVVVTA